MKHREYIAAYDKMEGWLLYFMVANSLGLLLSVISGPLTDPLYLIETGLRVVILVGIGFRQRWGYYGWLAYAGAAIFSILSVILVDPSFAFEWTPGSFGRPIVLELLVAVAWSSYFLFSYRVYSYLLATNFERSEEFPNLGEEEKRSGIDEERKTRSKAPIVAPIVMSVLLIVASYIVALVEEVLEPEFIVELHALELSESLPREYDRMVFNSARARGTALVYSYTMADSIEDIREEGWDRESLDLELLERNRPFYCDYMQNYFWQVDALAMVTMIHEYRDKSGELVSIVKFTRSDCEASD